MWVEQDRDLASDKCGLFVCYACALCLCALASSWHLDFRDS
jgi:hypothetical protein